MTPQSLMRTVGLASVDLCKLDIEGAEGPLMLSGDPAWLGAVGSMLAELHGEMVDAAAVRAAIEASGLLHNACGTGAEFFARPAWLEGSKNGSPAWPGSEAGWERQVLTGEVAAEAPTLDTFRPAKPGRGLSA